VEKAKEDKKLRKYKKTPEETGANGKPLPTCTFGLQDLTGRGEHEERRKRRGRRNGKGDRTGEGTAINRKFKP